MSFSRFDGLYEPWLNFTPSRTPDTPYLELACCLTASRQVELLAHARAALQKLTEDTVIKMVFNPQVYESMESIQVLLILALWPPTHQGGNIKDGRMLIASAVSMAMNMGLSGSTKRLDDMRKAQPGTHTPEQWADAELRAQVVCPIIAPSLECLCLVSRPILSLLLVGYINERRVHALSRNRQKLPCKTERQRCQIRQNGYIYAYERARRQRLS